MNVEEARLQTFHSWPSNAPVEAERLARGGFFATGAHLETQCHWCKKKISDWEFGDHVMIRHRALDPRCPFVQNQSYCGNIPLTSSSSTTGSQQESSSLDYKNENSRLATFKNWPNPNISPQSLAKAGFYYFNSSDMVKCAWCQGIIAQWESGDNAFEEHKRFFPDCPRVVYGPLIEIANNGISDLGIQQLKAPKKPAFSCLDARLRTFARWPRTDIQKPEILAQAGFYYQDEEDQVRCFHCNGGLRSWQKEDEPWLEHAKWFPNCSFVSLVKGNAYIKDVQENKRLNNAVTGNTREAIAEPLEDVMLLDDAMSTEPVQLALQMGLNEGRIRSATKRRLEIFGKPYEVAEELIEAVLEGQGYESDVEAEESISTIRELSRIINNIFIPRSAEGSVDYEESYQQRAEELPHAPFNVSTDNTRRSDASVNASSSGQVGHKPNPSIVPDIVSQTLPPTTSIHNPNTNLDENQSTPVDTSHPITEFVKQLSLEEENRKLKDARLCKVCMDDEVAVVFLPCGHLVTCVQCAPGVKMCPLCRADIKGLVRIFLS